MSGLGDTVPHDSSDAIDVRISTELHRDDPEKVAIVTVPRGFLGRLLVWDCSGGGSVRMHRDSAWIVGWDDDRPRIEYRTA